MSKFLKITAVFVVSLLSLLLIYYVLGYVFFGFGNYAEFRSSQISRKCLDDENFHYKLSDDSGDYFLVKIEDVEAVKSKCSI